MYPTLPTWVYRPPSTPATACRCTAPSVRYAALEHGVAERTVTDTGVTVRQRCRCYRTSTMRVLLSVPVLCGMYCPSPYCAACTVRPQRRGCYCPSSTTRVLLTVTGLHVLTVTVLNVRDSSQRSGQFSTFGTLFGTPF